MMELLPWGLPSFGIPGQESQCWFSCFFFCFFYSNLISASFLCMYIYMFFKIIYFIILLKICTHSCLHFYSAKHQVAASQVIIIKYIEKHNSIWKYCASKCVWECVCVARVWLGRQVSWTTNIVCRLVSTMASSPDLLTPWPNPNQNTTPSPCPEPPRPYGFKPHSAETGLTANLHCWHTIFARTHTSHTPSYEK